MQKEAEEKGWNAIAIRHDWDTAYFKKFQKTLKPEDLTKLGAICDLYVYEPNLDPNEHEPKKNSISNVGTQ